MYGGQGSGSKSEFSPFTLRDQGIKLKLSGLVQVPSPAEPSHQPLNFIEKKIVLSYTHNLQHLTSKA